MRYIRKLQSLTSREQIKINVFLYLFHRRRVCYHMSNFSYYQCSNLIDRKIQSFIKQLRIQLYIYLINYNFLISYYTLDNIICYHSRHNHYTEKHFVKIVCIKNVTNNIFIVFLRIYKNLIKSFTNLFSCFDTLRITLYLS